jgi:hypothetical protein
MGVSRAILILAAAVAGAGLLFAVPWPEEAKGAGSPARVAHTPARPADPDSAGLPRSRQAPPSTDHPGPDSAALEETDSPDSQSITRGDGNAEALTAMLDDPVFIDVCARPAETEFELLEGVFDEARRVLNAFQTEECERRVLAGRGERVEGYRPGEPFKAVAGSSNEIQSYYVDGREAWRVVFSVEEYPDLHALNDQIALLGAELSSRRGPVPR